MNAIIQGKGSPMKTARGGLTLVEMLVVVSVVILVAVLLLPAIRSAADEDARKACNMNLSQIVSAVGTAAEEPAPPAKIAMRILYAGHPGSAREKDFVEFLGKYFTQVQTGDLATFDDKSADGFDVAILDYDGDGVEALHAPRPKLSQNYAHATVTVGVAGGLIGNQLRLKTGYE
jgi:type II secretory pathway pseudopilin PulG